MTSYDVACMSYLAAVHTMRIPQMPPLNYGVEVQSTESFLAGDGPIVAGALAAHGRRPLLLTNPVGADDEGRRITAQMRIWGVDIADPVPGTTTRTNIVACDDAGNRTWFSGLRGIAAQLRNLDLTALALVSAAYIDCYEVLGEAPLAALQASLDNNLDIYVNLGGGPPPSWLPHSGARRAQVIQTNGPEDDLRAAARMAEEVRDLGLAEIAVVTVGRYGAFASPRGLATHFTPALEVSVQQVQGAGSVFSAALIDGLQREMSLALAMERACAAGSLWCARQATDPFPLDRELPSSESIR